jgi:O-antigen ligase
MLISLRIWLSLSSRARWLLIACIVATVFFVGTALMSSGSLSELGILQRFAEVGSEEDAGSLGRLILWYGAFMAFLANPLGYGAGAAALLVSRTMPNWLGEMNVHNVYLQFAVDLGIQGLLAFVAVAVSCVRRFAWGHWRHPLGAAVVIYLILAFQGFRGSDHFMFLRYGALTIATRQEMAAGVDRDDEEEDAGVVAV